MTEKLHESRFPPVAEPVVEPGDEPAVCPTGVAILAILHLVGGTLLFGAQLFLWFHSESLEDSLRFIGIAPAALIVSVAFLSLLTVASGIGMWMGKKWGWWLASFYYVYGVFRNAAALATIHTLADQLGDSVRGPGFYAVKHSVRILVHLLLLAYLLKGNVLHYFGLETMSKVKAIGILITACIAVGGAISAINFLSR